MSHVFNGKGDAAAIRSHHRLGVPGGAGTVDVLTSRSTDGGLTWSNPVITATGANDKTWVVCDDTSTSPHYGNCYTEYDITSSGDSIRMRTSTEVFSATFTRAACARIASGQEPRARWGLSRWGSR